MSDIVTLLVFFQALGAAIGAGMAVWAELAYIRAKRDGRIDVAERAHLDALARGLWFGMTLLLLSSLGLVVAAYLSHATPQPALTPSYWTLIALSLVAITVSWALSRRRISFALGSASVFTAWWLLTFLAFGWMPPYSFSAALMSFIVATAIFYALLQYARMLAARA